MKQLLTYLAEVMVISGVLYGYYHFFLRNKRFHQYNRFYLLISSLLSIVLPFLSFTIYLQSDSESTTVLENLQVVVTDGPGALDGVVMTEGMTNTSFDWWPVAIYGLYAIGGLFLLTRFLLALRNIARLKRSHQVTEVEGIYFVSTSAPGTPFSFFNWLFWHREIDVKSSKGEQIFRHEYYHISQKHSLDIMILEVLTIFFWINPFFHIIRKEITAIHEFLADRFATGAAADPYYAELLLMNAIGTKQQLINPFFHNQIKRRIAMIIQPDKTRFRYFRKILALPLAVLLFGAFALSFKKKSLDPVAGPAVKVVIEAAHGGPDGGAVSTDGVHREGAVMLELAKLIHRLAPEYGVEVLLARDGEQRAGNASSNNEALKKSVELAKSSNADMYLSLHMNVTPAARSGKSGIEAYISSQRTDARSEQLSSILLQRLAALYTTDMRVRKSAQTIYVLDKNVCPAVLLELGYMNNAKDMAFMTNKDNQEKLARQILTSIRDFGNNSTALQPAAAAMTDTIPAASPQKEVVVIGRPAYSPLRDSTLVVLNGKVQKGNADAVLKTIDPNTIKEVNVLKDASAIQKYGKQAEQGVIEINTKTGEELEVKDVTLKEVTVQGFQTKPKGEVREVVVEGRPTTPSLEEVVVVGYGTPLQQEPTFTKVEVEPAFQGGVDAWRKYLQRNLNGKTPLENGAPAGNYTVFIQFVVDKDGKLSQFKPMTNHGYGMEEEVIRVLRSGPAWVPATQNGRKVNAIRKQPVTFSVVREVVKN